MRPMLSHYFPLDAATDAIVTLPKDLTEREAERLCLWVKALARPTEELPRPVVSEDRLPEAGR